jgi:hypothetical protein
VPLPERQTDESRQQFIDRCMADPMMAREFPDAGQRRAVCERQATSGAAPKSQAQRLASHTTTLATEYARQGKDWETELRQRAKEIALMKELGLSLAQAAPQAPPADNADKQDQEADRAAA